MGICLEVAYTFPSWSCPSVVWYRGVCDFVSFSRRKQRSFSLWQTNHLWRWHERASYCVVAWTYTCRRREYLSAALISFEWTEANGMGFGSDFSHFSPDTCLNKELVAASTVPFLFIIAHLQLLCLWSALLGSTMYSGLFVFTVQALVLFYSNFSGLHIWTNWSTDTHFYIPV